MTWALVCLVLVLLLYSCLPSELLLSSSSLELYKLDLDFKLDLFGAPLFLCLKEQFIDQQISTVLTPNQIKLWLPVCLKSTATVKSF